MGRKVTGPQDINIRKLIRRFENTKINIWRDIANCLKKARRKRVEANLSRLNRITSNGDVIVVPGKILGSGSLEKKITIAALVCSQGAREKIEKSGSKLITLQEVLDKHPSGANVRIIK